MKGKSKLHRLWLATFLVAAILTGVLSSASIVFAQEGDNSVVIQENGGQQEPSSEAVEPSTANPNEGIVTEAPAEQAPQIEPAPQAQQEEPVPLAAPGQDSDPAPQTEPTPQITPAPKKDATQIEITNTYKFYVDGVLKDTQILKDQNLLNEPESPFITNKAFEGWFIDGNKVDFTKPVSVSEDDKEIIVEAVFSDAIYVFFNYNNTVIATKSVLSNTTVDDTNVPLLVSEPGKAFSHWSTTQDGEPFDFSTLINQETILYAVLIDKWTVSFNTHGGSIQLPVYANDNEPIQETINNPVRNGYEFVKWVKQGETEPFDFTTAITENTKIEAIWNPVLTTYTVAYWQENANEDGYSYIESVKMQKLTGEVATFDDKAYPNFILNTEKTNETIDTVKWDGSTIRNVYYDRTRFTLAFHQKLEAGGDGGLLEGLEFPLIKYGQTVSEQWASANNSYPEYMWYVSHVFNDFLAYSEAPAMPNSNLTLYGRKSGNIQYVIYYLEDAPGNPEVKTPFRMASSAGLILTIEDYIAIPGYEVILPEDVNAYPVINPNTQVREWKIYYQKITAKIAFQKNDGTGQEIVVSDIPYKSDISNVAPAEYVVGSTKTVINGVELTFAGWYLNPVFAGEPYSFTGKTMGISNMLLYGKWNLPSHVVTAYKVNGKPDSTKVTVSHGNSAIETDYEATAPEGMDPATDFLGWYKYVNNRLVKYDFELPVVSDVEIYPLWKTQQFTVTYDLNEGIGELPVDTKVYSRGSDASVLNIAPQTKGPDGRIFLGWAVDGSNAIYHYGSKLNIQANTTLKALWGNPKETMKLSYDPNGGNGNVLVINALVNQKHEILSGIFARNGYRFIGWNTKKDGSGKAFKVKDKIQFILSEDWVDTLYAQWEKIEDPKPVVVQAQSNPSAPVVYSVPNTAVKSEDYSYLIGFALLIVLIFINEKRHNKFNNLLKQFKNK